MSTVIRKQMLIGCLIGLFFETVAVGVLYSQDASNLGTFKSEEGRFQMLSPTKPQYEKVKIGKAGEDRHEFTVPTKVGAFIISYQDNPNLIGVSRDQCLVHLEAARDTTLKAFQGKLVDSKKIELKKHPGIAFQGTLPQAGGETRCRYFLVETRLYQLMVVGMPAFVNSAETTRILDSFELLPTP